MRVRFGLQFKFTLFFTLTMTVLTIVLSYFLMEDGVSVSMKYNLNLALSIGRIASEIVEDKPLADYAATGREDEEYHNMIRQMEFLLKNTSIYYIYIVSIQDEENGIYLFDLKWKDGRIENQHLLGEKSSLKENYPGLPEIVSTKSASRRLDSITLENGEKLYSAYVPILDKNQNVTAFVGIDFDEKDIVQEISKMIRGYFTLVMIGMLFCLILLLLLVRILLLRPIYRIHTLARRVEEGDFNTDYVIRGHDEFSAILHVFQKMTRNIAGNMEETKRLNAAYEKYLPTRLPAFLGRESIVGVRLGDQAMNDMAVLSFQLADFQQTIRRMNTQEMMDSINQVLQVCIPVVTDRNGMVENFEDAGFRALFESDSHTALASAAAMCQRLNQMERLGQIDKNRAGIGIACGNVTMGIVGQEERMEAITVSQYRDIADWLQDIAEKYQAHILITGKAAGQIPAFSRTWHSRRLGFLYNPYTGYSDQIYDVYDGDSREEIAGKNATREDFERGVTLYCTGDYRGARKCFITVLKVFHRDRASREYIRLCDRKLHDPHADTEDIYFTRME